MKKFPSPPLAAMVGVMAMVATALPAGAQTRTVVVQDGPSTILSSPSETCAGAEAASLGLTFGWARVSTGAGTAALVDNVAAPFLGTPPLGIGAGRLAVATPTPGTGDLAMFGFGNPIAAGLPFNAFASLLVRISYQHNINAAAGGAAGPAPAVAVFLDLCGSHSVAPGSDDVLIYQPAAQSSPCLAGATGTWQECEVINNGVSGELISLANTLPPGFLLSDYLTATAGACGGDGPKLPEAPNPLLGVLAGGDASFADFDGAVDDTRLKVALPLLSPVPGYPADELRFDFEADCSNYGGDADGDCLCDSGFPNVINADTCPTDATNSDVDGDGVCDAIDNCYSTPNPDQANSDSDQVGNACDNCPTTFSFDLSDDDGDGIGNVCDICPNDTPNNPDGDGICTSVDNCPNDANANQSDVDGDDIGDVCDADDGAGLTLRKLEVLKKFPDKDRWGLDGTFDVSTTPTFLATADAQGLTAAVKRNDGTVLDTESWTGAECVNLGGSLRCRNATGGKIVFLKTKTPNVFKVRATVTGQTFAAPLPTIAQTPLRATITTPVKIDRHASATSCIPKLNFKKVSCTNP
ncbi:thrombospondin type 3 repeat-containing protein [Candidatus Binatia bacterium]|nr:thrombospondin type 3 repeat-containing protein [Candidatus Binatia bacterium]